MGSDPSRRPGRPCLARCVCRRRVRMHEASAGARRGGPVRSFQCARTTCRLFPGWRRGARAFAGDGSLHAAAPMLVPFMPRDLYPLDAKRRSRSVRPARSRQAQRGLNSGVLYFRIDEPRFGNVLYFQNLTAMNDYYRATKTKPDGAVGGVWPELGYLLPTPVQSGTPPTDPLKAGVEVTLSDAILVFRHEAPPDERESARQFLQMLGVAYKMIDLPRTEYRDWMHARKRTCATSTRRPRRRSSIMAIAISTPIHQCRISRHHGADVDRRGDPRLGQMVRRTASARGRVQGGARQILRQPSSRRCAAICPMSATTRTRTRSTAGISTTRCSTSAFSRSMATPRHGAC
jgi:hypothetical protein